MGARPLAHVGYTDRLPKNMVKRAIRGTGE